MEMQAWYDGISGKFISDGQEFNSMEDLYRFCISIHSERIKTPPGESLKLYLYFKNTTQRQMDKMSEEKRNKFGRLERGCKRPEMSCGHCSMPCEQ